jgi:hypothetical protein
MELDVAFVALVFVREKIVVPTVINNGDLTNCTKEQILIFEN